MRTQFYHDYKADLIFHLKRGPVSLTKKTIESLYLDSVPYGVSFQLGPLWVQRYPLGTDHSKDLLLARPRN